MNENKKILTEIVESLSDTRTNDAFRSLPATAFEEDADAIVLEGD